MRRHRLGKSGKALPLPAQNHTERRSLLGLGLAQHGPRGGDTSLTLAQVTVNILQSMVQGHRSCYPYHHSKSPCMPLSVLTEYAQGDGPVNGNCLSGGRLRILDVGLSFAALGAWGFLPVALAAELGEPLDNMGAHGGGVWQPCRPAAVRLSRSWSHLWCAAGLHSKHYCVMFHFCFHTLRVNWASVCLSFVNLLM